MSTAQTYRSDTILHEATGVTYHFADEVEYGYYWNGDVFVVSNGQDIEITKITPEDIPGDGRVMHGTMVQPDDTRLNGFDDAVSRGKKYAAENNVDPAVTGEPLRISHAEHPGGASVVKAISLEDLSTQRDRSVVEKFSVLTITPETPPENAFRPPVAGEDKTSAYTLADLDFSKLQNVAPVDGQRDIASYDDLSEATFVSWWGGNDPLRYFHPDSHHDGYNDYQLDDLVGAFMALHSDYSVSEKSELYAAIVQQGIDYAGGIANGVRWEADGGHGNLYKPFIVTAASALNSDELGGIAGAENVFSEDTQFRYITINDVEAEFFESVTNKNPKLGGEYQQVQVGMPEWVIRGPEDGRFDPSLAASYRWINSDNVPILALTMEMLGDGEGREIWGNEAYFDYAERVRLMHEIDVTPTIDSAAHIHMAQPEWMAFLEAYHDSFSAGSTMEFRPEAPLDVDVTVSGGGLDIAIGGEIFPGSAPVERVDLRYRSGGDEETWTVIEDFGQSGRLDGLTENQIYFAQARYVSAIGEGPWSNNGFEANNRQLIDLLKGEGFITDAYMEGFGGQRQYQKTEDYKDHLRSILAGEEGYQAMADDVLAATAILTPPKPGTSDTLDFGSLPIADFRPGDQDYGDHSVSVDGTMLSLDSQAWQSVMVDVEVAADTRLSFDFAAGVEGEMHGVMFVNDDAIDEAKAFKLHGTQDWGIQTYDSYGWSGAFQHFDIPVGEHFTGSFDRVVFVTDDDAGVGADSVFRDVTFSSGDTPPAPGTGPGTGPGGPDPIVYPGPGPERVPEPEDEASAMGVVQQVAGLDHEARTVDFRDGMVLEDAIVFATAPSFDGSHPASVALEAVTATGATMSIREPEYLDGWHLPEDLTMLALDAGSWTLGDGSRLEVGRLDLAAGPTERFAEVTFEQAFDATPAILVQLQSSNGADWAVLRTRDVTATGFEVALQEQEASDGRHEAEIVGWMALDAAAADGLIDWSGMAAQAFTAPELADHDGGRMAFDAALGTEALVAAGISSFHGSDTATLRLQEIGQDGAQSFADLVVQEEQSADWETDHKREDISGIAFAREGTLAAHVTPADLMLVEAMYSSTYIDVG